jgi:hypothetical protein
MIIKIQIDGEDLRVLSMEAARHRVSEQEFILNEVKALLSELHACKERRECQDSIISAMRAKLEEMPDLVSLFSNERLKFDKTASIIADRMEKEDIWGGD